MPIADKFYWKGCLIELILYEIMNHYSKILFSKSGSNWFWVFKSTVARKKELELGRKLHAGLQKPVNTFKRLMLNPKKEFTRQLFPFL